ncbi:MAG: tyrosine-type recombinase/integrase [Chitinispirillaceae bacterium]
MAKRKIQASSGPVQGYDMDTVFLPDGRTRITYHYRRHDGIATHARRIVNSQAVVDIVKTKARILSEIEQKDISKRSVQFEAVVDLAIKKGSAKGQPWVYKAIREKLNVPIDKAFPGRFQDFIQDLEEQGKCLNTVSHHKSAVRTCLNLAVKRGLIESSPVKDYGIKYEFRDRIWTAEERQRIYNVIQQINSHLYWSVWFAERRPIRGRSDLWKLTDENLVLFGPNAPYIRFRAQKTAKRKTRDTYLPLGDMPEIIEYFTHGRPKGCTLLFPHVEKDRKDNVKWSPMGNPRRHWVYVCEKANVHDFRFHDLKHIAVTHMLDHGYSVRDLQNLGIQFSEEMINRVYYNYGADKVLAKMNKKDE